MNLFDVACKSFKNNNAWFGWPKYKPDMKIAEHFYKLGGNTLDENKIKKMVDRFLSWDLPEDFNPDGGVKFDAYEYQKMDLNSNHVHKPTGTNLFTARQATDMVRHILDLDKRK